MTHKERILAHLDKFDDAGKKYLNNLTEEQAKCICSYWDDPVHFPHVVCNNTYSRTFTFLGLNQSDELTAQLFGTGLK